MKMKSLISKMIKNKKTLIVALLAMIILVLTPVAKSKLLSHTETNGNNSSSKAADQTQTQINQTTQEDLGDFYISIPKLNVVAPIIRGVDPADKEKYNLALKDGVAHMTGTPLPGSGKGNIFIYGHS